MDDNWDCADEDSISSNSNLYSDNVDSDVEAELYGVIHHHENIPLFRFQNGENTEETLDIVNPIANQTKYIHDETSECESIRSYKYISHNNPKVSEFQNTIKKTGLAENYQEFNSLLKRKCVSEESLSSIIWSSDNSGLKDSSVPSLKTKENKILAQNSQKSPTNGLQIVLDTSDSDCIILTEPTCSDQNVSETNLHKDIDIISISSSEDSLVMSSSFRDEGSQKNLSMPNIKIGCSSKGMWHVNNEDLFRSRKRPYHFRYYRRAFQISKRREGFISKFRRRPKVLKCFFCGGAHEGFRCVNRMCCRCYGTGHESSSCYMSSVICCYHCGMKGHVKTDCPDIWRRYHLTTETANIVEGKPLIQNSVIYCYNCGFPEHFGGECNASRSFYDPFPTWPCVISYNDHNDPDGEFTALY